MNKLKHINKTVGVVLTLLLVIEVLFDPFSSILHFSQSIKAKLLMPLAWRKWESQGVTHYSFDVYANTQICFLGKI